MSSRSYYLLWLAVGLLVIALASALIARRLRSRDQRQVKALELLETLALYSEWVAAQGRAVLFQGTAQESESALLDLGRAQVRWFPELQPQFGSLEQVHASLVEYLRGQHRLRLEDPETWFESEQDAGFALLWQEHCRIVATMERPLALATRSGVATRQTFPA